ncbi:phage protein NinX family protein [Yersinia rochesterensis]|uniref:phage protein NinX family protein n=1 Tax=Yersinia rochesterensis TaxID=1604335 RepID=UPI0011A91B4E|nr:phage protein NinX family protein [Yersinia rochesterensis]
MKDYSAMSDFEINKAVANIVFSGEIPRMQEDSLEFGILNYCKNPEQAWPIIAENKISLNWSEIEKEWCAHVAGVMTEGCWCWDDDPAHHHDDSNPLRAAMIVFLMMKDRESSHADA